MTLSAIILAVLIPAILWGGFAVCLVIAMRRESRKTE